MSKLFINASLILGIIFGKNFFKMLIYITRIGNSDIVKKSRVKFCRTESAILNSTPIRASHGDVWK